MSHPSLLMLVMIGLLSLAADPSSAATPSAPPQPSAADKSEEREPAHRVLLLGATIFGTVAAPNATYDIPWQEPFLLGRGATELDRNFLKEIFKPVDREEFLKTVPATTSP